MDETLKGKSKNAAARKSQSTNNINNQNQILTSPKKRNFIETIKDILINPWDFFTSIKDESGIGKPFGYYMKILGIYMSCLLIVTLISTIINSAIFKSPLETGFGFGPGIEFVIIFGVFLLIFLLIPIEFFIGAGIIHLLLLIVGAKGSFGQTIKVMSYSITPTLILTIITLLNIIPVLGSILVSILSIPISIYSLVLQVIGASKLHDISYLRASIAIIIIPLVIITIIVIFLVIVFVSLIMDVTNLGGITGMITNSLS